MANWRGGYRTSAGTSYAAPLTAGAIALIKEAHPSWVLEDILENMKEYSIRTPFFDHIGPQLVIAGETLDLRISTELMPDNNYGWGIPDFGAVVDLPEIWYGGQITLEAVQLPENAFFEDSLNGAGLFTFTPDQSQIGEDTATFASFTGNYSDTESVRIMVLDEPGSLSAITAPHPAVDSAVFIITPNNLGTGKIYIHEISGMAVREFDFESISGNFIRVVWDGKNGSGRYVASGVYILTVSLGGTNITDKFFFVSSR
jgi:hypothetical protein